MISAGPRNSLQNLLKTQTMQGELVTVQTMHLSAWEFVVYQYGLSVLHLLIPQLQVHLFLAFCEAVSHEAVEVRVARKRLKRHQIISRKKFLQQWTASLRAADGSYDSSLKSNLWMDSSHVQKPIKHCLLLIIFMRQLNCFKTLTLIQLFFPLSNGEKTMQSGWVSLPMVITMKAEPWLESKLWVCQSRRSRGLKWLLFLQSQLV